MNAKKEVVFLSENWMESQQLSGLDKNKLQLLQKIAEQGTGKSPSELLPFLLSSIRSDKTKALSFSPEEISLILEVLKSGKTPEEVRRMEKIIALAKNMH
jgi:hypothetical protein